jgi:hypothetical protein
MNKLRERWEFIIGYVALIVSLSAFKEELTHINLNLGFITTTAAQFLFILIIGFFITLHLYLIPFLLSSTRYANIRILRYLESLSYFIFVLLAVSPIFMLIVIGINNFVNIISLIPIQTKDVLTSLISAIIAIITSIVANSVAVRYRKQKYSSEKQELEFQEIKEFENAQKLFNDGYYSQSILEAFKALELHLRRLIAQKDVPFRSTRFQDVKEMSMKLELISKSEIAVIDNIRQMRNSAAHLDVEFTKAQASDAISFIKELIRKTSNSSNNSAA